VVLPISGVTEYRCQTVLEIVGFDSDGRFVGSAEWTLDGWRVTTTIAGKVAQSQPIHHEHDARERLREAGAVQFWESDGIKR
jgi:hypothetical protein